MIEYIKDNWQGILVTIGTIVIIGGFTIFMVTVMTKAINKQNQKCEDNPRSCMSEGKIECLDAGGIFYYGGSFSSDNCVFPPK